MPVDARQRLLEREEELDLLAGLLANAGSTGGRVVLIRGEAGIGKSALVREFLAVHADEAHVLIGWCDDLLTPRPLSPFWDMARSELSLAEPLGASDRTAVLEILMDLLSRGLRPTMLVIEDTQWVDEATLDAIKYLGRRIEDTNGLLILTYRDAEVDYDHPLRTVIGEIPPQDLVRIHLPPLSVEAVAVMIEGVDLDLDELMVLTDGNPLFVTQMLTSIGGQVPKSIQDSVLARAAKLSTRGRETLDLISVIPGAAERAIVAAIAGATDDDLAEAVRQGLIEVGENVVHFHHELSRRAVESALSPGHRRRLNARVLTKLATVPERANPARLVHHAREAGDVKAIVEHAPRAARAARDVEGHREAVEYFHTLEPYLDQIEPADRAALLEDWAHTEEHLDNLYPAVDKLNRAVDIYRVSGDDVAVGRALTFATRLYETTRRPDKADQSMNKAVAILDGLGTSPELAYAVSQQAWLSMMRGDDQQAAALADQATELAGEAGDELTAINALNTKGCVTFRQGDRNGMAFLEDAWKRAVDGGHAYEEIRALHNMTWVALRQRELDQAHTSARRTLKAAARYKHTEFDRWARADLAPVLLRTGDWDTAEDLANEVLATLPPGETWLRAEMYWTLCRLKTRRGRPQARSALEHEWAQVVASREPYNIVSWAAVLAEWMWVTDETDQTDHHLIEQFRGLLDQVLQLGNTWDTGQLALWLWKMDELAEIPEGIAEPYRLVMKGRPEAAADIWKELGYPYEKAIALSHGDTTARLEALNILEELGAIAVADKLRQELRNQGLAPPRRKTGRTKHSAGLTARQTEVLSLLGDGLSNIDIADRLFLSPRTVEHHVAAVMSKLNAPTRQDAVTKAREQGLLTSS